MSPKTLHLARPTPTTAHCGPLKVIIDPVVLLSILNHANRRPEDQERVIGTLLGSRNEDGSEIELKTSFAVPHNESTDQDQVEVDMEYHKTMSQIHSKTNPRENLVGWYATTSNLNTFSALIQNFYASQIDAPSVHLTIGIEPGKQTDINCYVSSGVGVTPERGDDSCYFVPVPWVLKDSEKSALDALNTQSTPSSITHLTQTLTQVQDLLSRAIRYVDAVISGTEKPNVRVGRHLLSQLENIPQLPASQLEEMFGKHVQDVLLIEYLSEAVKSQVELAAKLGRIC
ncbi:Eukaryotic translation initiation factor 3 subunit F [Neolecta irregularis DAH-3]|uniref:Eukaryotic translation initiation factor 3 subunit F n=1 Tax=Neolecta irregularis (strain DAH-3) TaxID=1198029 RepID=A0A1U7LK62_NEOID|nr:Eukaryotic translation initiation factor 3 subunit F [Neolecta irregularis DAH-3]|eukprot:OLL23029.1 Eukaryotic translation initiation factor 3 subunit F [Neolecta irregularis DAH-3]